MDPPLSPQAQAYLRVFEAWLELRRERDDHEFLVDLKNWALEELLMAPVRLHDIGDVQGFVYERLDSQFPNLDWQEREELAAEGVVILLRMAKSFKPRLEGHDQDGRFSGYAARYLPRRLIRAWHRLHPEHVIVRQGGKERVEYRSPAEPLEDGTVTATVVMAETTMDTLRYALRQQVANEIEFTMQVATLRGMSLPRGQIAESLGCTPGEVRMAEMRLARVRDELGGIDY